jgi:antirestriction protein ArdC
MAKAKMKDKIDAALAELTERVITAIEEDPGNWTKPWRDMMASGLPTNVLTRKRYSGGNLFWLSVVSDQNGWTNYWGTYKQWKQLGGQVRKGESGTLAMFYKPVTITKDEDGETVEKTVPFLRGFYLFNATQVEGGMDIVAERMRIDGWDRDTVDPIDHAEKFFAVIGADVRFGGNRAFYNHDRDFIQLPERDQFVSSEAFYAATAHEHTHWTGSPDRLNRTKGKHFGDELYAREELVAQLGAAFVLAYLDIDTDAEGCQVESYLASWLKTLKEQPRALWSVLGDASKALNLLTELAGENGYERDEDGDE